MYDNMNYNAFYQANVILNVTGNAQTLPDIINSMPFLTWIHSITAGVDHLLCPEITENEEITLTNAKGIFSSSLAEYVMLACLHFSKQVPRWMNNQREKKWEKFTVSELRGQTMGIVGYGNIGQACARLAKAFGMHIIALRRNPEFNSTDHIVDEVSFQNVPWS
jgi:phosphoglycerate dehydrogenase-like enzyme